VADELVEPEEPVPEEPVPEAAAAWAELMAVARVARAWFLMLPTIAVWVLRKAAAALEPAEKALSYADSMLLKPGWLVNWLSMLSLALPRADVKSAGAAVTADTPAPTADVMSLAAAFTLLAASEVTALILAPTADVTCAAREDVALFATLSIAEATSSRPRAWFAFWAAAALARRVTAKTLNCIFFFFVEAKIIK